MGDPHASSDSATDAALSSKLQRPPPSPGFLSPAAAEKFKNIKLFLCDVDGVLTDCSVVIGEGKEFKRFHIQDGLGLRILQREGIRVGWISNRPSQATEQRWRELKLDYLHQKDGNKVLAAQEIIDQAGVDWAHTAYMGDDVVDLGLLHRSGVAIAPPNAILEARVLADYVTQAAGGHGAVREAAECILKCQGRWERIVNTYAGGR